MGSLTSTKEVLGEPLPKTNSGEKEAIWLLPSGNDYIAIILHFLYYNYKFLKEL